MPKLGTFKPDANGFSGSIRTLGLNARLRFVTNDKKGNDKAPDYHVKLGQTRVGAAWQKVNDKTGATFLSVRLDDPTFVAPIHAVLVNDPETDLLNLVWRRPTRNEG